jgi:hypothetical protein
MTAQKNPVGRPLKFESVEAFEQQIDAYFTECDREEDTRIFAHAGYEVADYPELEKGQLVLKKQLVCQKCRRDFRSEPCTLVSGHLKKKKPYTVTVFIGVGCTRLCDFKRGCDGQLPGVSVIVPADEVIRDRRTTYEQTGDPTHLNYEHKFASDLAKYGRQNPEVRRNYFLEDTVEEGNFVSRERLTSCARPAGATVPTDKLFAGIDWARSSDHTWLTVANHLADVVDWFKYPHVPYQQQVEMMVADLKAKGYLGKILGVRADDTGMGGPTEILQTGSGLPVGEDSFFKFTLQGKNELYLGFEEVIFKDLGAEGRFSYPADHALASEFEEQTAALLRDYKGEGEYLCPHHPDEPGAHDDAPDSTALALLAARGGFSGEILFV